MTRIAILGASGLAREAAAVAEALRGAGEPLEVVGFIDVALQPGEIVGGLPILGDEAWFATAEGRGVLAVPALGDPGLRRRSVEAVERYGGAFTSLIHPTVSRGPRVTIGNGCLLLPMSSLTTDISIADFVSINPGCTLGHDVRVGRFVNLSPGTRLSGFVEVEEGADLGAGSVVLPGLTVGAGAVIGAGGVAVRDVGPGLTVVGVPARPLERGVRRA